MKYTKDRLRYIVDTHYSVLPERELRVKNREAYDVLIYLETILYEDHIETIRKRQDQVPNLWRDESGFLAVWNGELPPGCKHCLRIDADHRGTHAIRSVRGCQLNCKFCYYRGEPGPMLPKNRYMAGQFTMTADELIALSIKLGKEGLFTGAAWVYGEPLLSPEKIEAVARRLHAVGYHQWLYTNGLLMTEDMSKFLRDVGIDEVRFNLQATNFSRDIIKKMGVACKYIKYVGIETPMFSATLENYKRHGQRILDTGLDFINVPELQIKRGSMYDLGQEEGKLYRHRIGYLSPISSRHYTYDLIDLANSQSWPITIHDCSNDTKFYRNIQRDGGSNYRTFLTIPKERYYDAIEMIGEYPVEIWGE